MTAYRMNRQRLEDISQIYIKNKLDISKGFEELKEYVNTPEHRDHFIACINGANVAVDLTSSDGTTSADVPSARYSRLIWLALLVVGLLGMVFAAYKYLSRRRDSCLALLGAPRSMQNLRSR